MSCMHRLPMLGGMKEGFLGVLQVAESAGRRGPGLPADEGRRRALHGPKNMNVLTVWSTALALCDR